MEPRARHWREPAASYPRGSGPGVREGDGLRDEAAEGAAEMQEPTRIPAGAEPGNPGSSLQPPRHLPGCVP
ncbi:unnamed protein product [Caretta caretta]